MRMILFLLLILCPATVGCGVASPSDPVEFIDLKPSANTEPTKDKPVVYFYTQQGCSPCIPHHKYWEDRKWQTDSFRVEEVDLSKPHDKKHDDWVDVTPSYGWMIGETRWNIEDQRPADQTERAWKATNR